MKNKIPQQLPVSLYGMDGRTHKTITLFIQGPCKDIAQLVDEVDAQVDIIDGDTMDAKTSLEHCLARTPRRPIIILSLEPLKIEHTIYVKKPTKMEDMLQAFKEARSWLEGKNKKKPHTKTVTSIKNQESIPSKDDAVSPKTSQPKPDKKPQIELELATEKKVFVNYLEQKKTEKHKTAQLISEGKFASFIGLVPGINFDNPAQWPSASYNPKHYYQGYVQSAIKVASEKSKVIKLSSGWNPLIIFPHSHEIWLNADDKQLRSFAALLVSKMVSTNNVTMKLSPVNPKEESFTIELDKFQQMDAFLWKLACWTSKGRYPTNLDLVTPIMLKSWPNFTRLVVTPHALQISALLITGPRSIQDIIKVLKIKPQYVFIFVSAAYAIGLLSQCQPTSSETVNQAPPQPIKSSRKKGLLSRIMSRLRG